MLTGTRKSTDSLTGKHHKALMSDDARYEAFKKREDAFKSRVKKHASKDKALHHVMMRKMNKK